MLHMGLADPLGTQIQGSVAKWLPTDRSDGAAHLRLPQVPGTLGCHEESTQTVLWHSEQEAGTIVTPPRRRRSATLQGQLVTNIIQT